MHLQHCIYVSRVSLVGGWRSEKVYRLCEASGFGGFTVGSPGRGETVLDTGDDAAVLIGLILAPPPQHRQTDCASATDPSADRPKAAGGAIIEER